METNNTQVNEESTVTTGKKIDLLGHVPNGYLTSSYYTTKVEGKYKLFLPSVRLKTLEEMNGELTRLNDHIEKHSSKEWKEAVEGSAESYTQGGLYQNRVDDPTSVFKQGVELSDGTLRGIESPKIKDGVELKGEVAILRLAKKLGKGEVVNVPLPHSGIWVTIKPPTESSMIDFYNTLARDKVYLGNATKGLTISNFSVNVNKKLVEFIISHIHSVNYKDIPKEDLMNYILIHDLPVLLWGFASSMYPNGFEFARACLHNPETCDHVLEGTINVSKLLWIDNPSLTEAQTKIMEEFRPNLLTVDNYRKYISEHNRVSSTRIEITDGLYMTTKIPTLNEYFNEGLKWVNELNATIDKIALDTNDDEEAKKEALEAYIKTSILRQFNHFVDYFEHDGSVIEDRETINKYLELLSSDDKARETVNEGLVKMISDTTIALVGIPKYDCPKCGEDQGEDNTPEKFTDLIPLDVTNVFFTLLTIRVTMILIRDE